MWNVTGFLKQHPRVKTVVTLTVILASPLVMTQTAIAGDLAIDNLVPAKSAPIAPLMQQSFSNYTGGQHAIADFKDKVVLVDFWASWCSPCRSSFPWMDAMSAKYADQGFQVVAVNLDQNSQQAEDFLNQLKPQFTVLFDPEGNLPEAYQLIGMPTSYLLDRQGRIRLTHIGFHKNKVDAYEQQIQALLQEAPL